MDILDRFLASTHPTERSTQLLRAYFNWQAQHLNNDFNPGADDDIDLRNYLLHLHLNGANLTLLEEHTAVLKDFYSWLKSEGSIPHNPFTENQFLRPFLTSDQIKPRLQDLAADPKDRELERLRALSQIVEQLISSLDIQSALDSTLTTLLKVMHLQTGWVSLLTNSPLELDQKSKPASHGFTLAAACGLPPGLEHNDRHFLKKPPPCHCQRLLLHGGLTRAINIVECTRLRESLRVAGDNQDLRFHASVPLISQGKPLGVINVATEDFRFLTQEDLKFLSAVSTRVSAALERAHYYDIAERRRVLLENELITARIAQASLMPLELPGIPGFKLASAWKPALQVAGDFFDIFPLDDHRWGLVIGDVADKGTAAALYMALIHGLIRTESLRNRSPSAILKEVNRTILRQSSSGIFVTVFLAVLDLRRDTLQYANAGHNPPILRRVTDQLDILTHTGAVLGMLEDLDISDISSPIHPGDGLIMYTDGVTEAWNPKSDQDFYGEQRLKSAILAAPKDAAALLDHLEADLSIFTQDASAQDDVTFLVLTRD